MGSNNRSASPLAPSPVTQPPVPQPAAPTPGPAVGATPPGFNPAFAAQPISPMSGGGEQIGLGGGFQMPTTTMSLPPSTGGTPAAPPAGTGQVGQGKCPTCGK